MRYVVTKIDQCSTAAEIVMFSMLFNGLLKLGSVYVLTQLRSVLERVVSWTATFKSFA